MNRQGIIVIGSFLAACVFLLFTPSNLLAEESAAVAADTDAKLADLSDEEIDAIDEKLSKAMVLYYDRKYNQALPMFLDIADRIYLTIIHGEFEGDTFFPEFDESRWNLTSRSDYQADDRNPCDYSFLVYDRK